MSSLVDYVRAIVDDIPADTTDPDLQEKARIGSQLLQDLDPLLNDTLAAVGEAKDVVQILETRLSEETKESLKPTIHNLQ